MIDVDLDRSLIPTDVALAETVQKTREVIKHLSLPMGFTSFVAIIAERLGLPEAQVEEAFWCLQYAG